MATKKKLTIGHMSVAINAAVTHAMPDALVSGIANRAEKAILKAGRQALRELSAKLTVENGFDPKLTLQEDI